MKKQVCVGLFAHVDAGKTTLAESLLYTSGAIASLGRVDHQDAFLDTDDLEKSRGITIFSKQAQLTVGDLTITLMDTPGHVDFVAEAERTLPILDAAILVISGADGVQGHTRTLWQLLARYQIPTFLFFNKMDQPGTDRARLMAQVKERLNEACVAFDVPEPERFENAALCGEEAFRLYDETGAIPEEMVADMIQQRQLFPCYFGSALKLSGVDTFLSGLTRDLLAFPVKEKGKEADAFGAIAYQISRDEEGTRLTHLKITSGKLAVRDSVGSEEEKVHQIRLYSGAKYETLSEALPGMVVAVTGPKHTWAGESFGVQQPVPAPSLLPVLTYQLLLPKGTDENRMLQAMRQLEEEDPLLSVVWREETRAIDVQLMGEVQTQVLTRRIQDRFGVAVSFGPGRIIYRETIQHPVEGVGHFEPLRHYAEVHLKLEPGAPGSGRMVKSDCPQETLQKPYQQQVLTTLREEPIVGVQTGALVTDVCVTLVAGRASENHTQGGDFREATRRALRQGLMQAETVLLEPVYHFSLELTEPYVGRALTDVQQMAGRFDPPEAEGDFRRITGTAPVSEMQGYAAVVAAYTKGEGRLSLEVGGYEPCHNQTEVVSAIGYDPESDAEHPAGSVFCAHGVGFSVPWDQVEAYMHVGRTLPSDAPKEKDQKRKQTAARDEDAELEEIFLRTYGKVEHRHPTSRTVSAPAKKPAAAQEETPRSYLLVDGYNVIFAWEDLHELASMDLGAARGRLMDILCNYQGYTKCTLILVFDAYKLTGNTMEISTYHNIHVVYTKEAEIADTYIEKVVHEIGRKYEVTVVTSDGLEQVITVGQGSHLISAREFRTEVERVNARIREEIADRKDPDKDYLFDHMDEETAREMEEIRLGHGDEKTTGKEH